MSLSGNLGFVPLDEVLRLMSRSERDGSVHVTGGGFRGRVFVTPRGIDLATTFDDSELSRHLSNSGFVGPDMDMATVAETNIEKATALIREMTVESLYQISIRGMDFDVRDGEAAPLSNVSSFDLESILDDASHRASEWEAVSRHVPDLAQQMGFERELGERDSITIPADAWKIVTEIGVGSSVDEIADRLGTTTFWTAQVASKLIDDSLLRFAGESAAAPDMTVIEEPEVSDGDSFQSTEQWQDASEDQATAEEVEQISPVREKASDSETSWWQESTTEDEPAAQDEEDAEESVFGRFAARSQSNGDGGATEEGLSTMPTLTATPAETVEDDTEAFLEKVFSELGSEGEAAAQDDEAEGYGLLRRRRLGTPRDGQTDS